MERELPAWLDEAFLSTVLQGGEDKEPTVTVTRFSAKPAVGVGENFASHMIRVKVDYKVEHATAEESVSLIVKVPITKGVVGELSEDFDLFSTEPIVYNKLLPRMYKKTKSEFGPKTFYCPIKNVLVLEDMKQQGYIMCDKYKQLDFSHCKIVLETLAKFHATSVACHRDDPELIETVGKEIIYTEDGLLAESLVPWIKASIKFCANVLKDIGGQQLTVDYFLSRVDNIKTSFINFLKPTTGSLAVLNHRDCWVNNLLFKHDDSEQVIDVKLIDYQLVTFGTLAIDLTHFIWSSANEEVRENKIQELYEIYRETLSRTFEELGLEERLTPEQLKQDLKAAVDWVIVHICLTLPFIMCDPENMLNMEEYSSEDLKNMENNEKFIKFYSNERYRALLPALSKQFQSWLSLYNDIR